ncbi:MAG: hypothetical protein ACKPAE_18455, partial [Microcystis panniformis]
QKSYPTIAIGFAGIFINTLVLESHKVFRWGVGCGVLSIFREKVPNFPPRLLQRPALFDVKKA